MATIRPAPNATTDGSDGPGPSRLTDPTEVVLAFLAALERLDVDAARALLDPEIEYQNVPLPPARGIKEVEKQLNGFMKLARGFRVINHNVAAEGPVVLTERTDIFTIGRVDAGFWVCGTFEVHDGRITLWRDRFDWIDVLSSYPRGLVRKVLGRAHR